MAKEKKKWYFYAIKINLLNAEKKIERNKIKKNGSILNGRKKNGRVNSRINKKASFVLDTQWSINIDLFPLKLYQII